MEAYKNLRGGSPVSGYEIDSTYIDVQFGNKIYRYSHVTPGREHVERMKKLARMGSGLAAYISSNIYGYETKRHDH